MQRRVAGQEWQSEVTARPMTRQTFTGWGEEPLHGATAAMQEALTACQAWTASHAAPSAPLPTNFKEQKEEGKQLTKSAEAAAWAKEYPAWPLPGMHVPQIPVDAKRRWADEDSVDAVAAEGIARALAVYCTTLKKRGKL